jgi:bifunctional UDP-N-acetylglucosamine pyrophosphorylase/glucosamine-1-phosphate N-acetyltransferase
VKAVVLAAGEGTRMRPLTATRPKPLLPVGTGTLVEHVLDACHDHVDGFVVVVGYRADDVERHLGDEYRGKPVTYVEQQRQRGTADAVEAASDALDDRFLVLNGDVVIDPELVERLVAVGGNAMAVTAVDDPHSYGVVSVEDDAVVDLVEKPDDPPSRLANVGAYAFEHDTLEFLARTGRSARGEREITETIRLMIDAGRRFAAVEYEGAWLDVGRPWELLDANAELLHGLERRLDGEVADSARIDGPVVVEEGAAVDHGVSIEGPAVVGEGATVGPNAYIRGSTVVGADAHVGHAVEVKNSVLMEDANVGHLSYVGDSVIGGDVNLGAGTVVANLRHDDETVVMTVKDERIDTGRRKLGVVLGDGVKTGINTSLNAGVKLGVGARTGPGETVTHDVEGREP